MARYKLQGPDESNGVFDTETFYSIPNSDGNRHWEEYKLWKEGKDVNGDALPGNPGLQTPDPQYTLDEEKSLKKEELRQDCKSAIQGGFTSSATGTEYTYQSDEKDQINLIGANQAGVDMEYTVIDGTGNKVRVQHTVAQLLTVFSDGVAAKQAHINNLYAKYALVDAASSKTDLDAITF